MLFVIEVKVWGYREVGDKRVKPHAFFAYIGIIKINKRMRRIYLMFAFLVGWVSVFGQTEVTLTKELRLAL